MVPQAARGPRGCARIGEHGAPAKGGTGVARTRPVSPGTGVDPMTFDLPTRAVVFAAVTVAVTSGATGPAVAAQPTSSSAPWVSVIVTEQADAASGPERAVTALGVRVGRQLGIIEAFAARVPADRLAALRATPGVREVTEDVP